MKTYQILDFEKENEDKIHLFRGPLFWKAYEVSAYIFCTQIKQLKVAKHFVNIAGTDIVSVGFPISSQDKFINGLDVIEETSSMLTLKAKNSISLQDFLVWKEAIQYSIQSKNHCKSEMIEAAIECGHSDSLLKEKILGLNLAKMTPFDALHFLADLQEELTK